MINDGFLLSAHFHSLKCLGSLSSLTGSKSILSDHTVIYSHTVPLLTVEDFHCRVQQLVLEGKHPSRSPGNRHVVEETFSVSYRRL